MANESDSSAPKGEGRGGGPQPELRLLDRRAFVGFPPLAVAPGVTISDFALLIPDVSFPFNVSSGASRYQRRRLHFGFLELTVEAEAVGRAVAEVAGRLGELEDVRLHFRAGLLEAQARLRGPERTPLTFKVAFDGDGERLAVFAYDVRLYGFSPTPSVSLPLLLTRALAQGELLPEVAVRGGSGFTTRVLPALCQKAAVSRGFKVPELHDARLAAAEVTPRGLKLRFAAGGLPPPAPPDEELLLTLEGARAFADAEALLAEGRLAEAREAYLRSGDVAEAHPFAAERLLSLLVADPQAHELALDVAASLLKRRDRSPAALWGEAVVRERRGEAARAAERFLALCAQARKAGEEAAAFFAAEAAARAARDAAPQVAVRALHEVLGLKPDHLPSLQALARAADLARDRVGAVRAYRRIAALARDTSESAAAHVQLARLCADAEDDVAGARLHCEAALRLTPDQPDALLLLGELCHRSGEHLRALKALDRLREVAMARHELDRVGRADLLAGRVWEEGLKQHENALLRYREAAALLPQEPEVHFLLARTAEALGKVQEALAGYAQAVELAGPAPRDAAARSAAHRSHHALARLSRTRLGDPARGRSHLEAALALEPQDTLALEELIPAFRATGRTAELADACEKAALALDEPSRRAAFWAEAGELHRTRLGNPEKAERLLTAALEADGRNRPALEGLLALAEGRRDGPLLCRCLRQLAALAPEPAERVRLLRRLAVAARDLAFDLEGAVEALQKVLQLEPEDAPALGELCALQRRRGDAAGLAQALEARARAAEGAGDRRLAAAALRELAQVYEARLGRLGEALVALEKAARLAPEPAVLLELADLSVRAERPEHARRALEDVLTALPKGTAAERVAEVRARLGRACELMGDRAAAVEAYARAFPARRLDDALAERLEALYQEAGEQRALAELRAQRAQALLAAGRPQEAAGLLLASAQGLLALGEGAGALARLHAALDAGPAPELAAQALDAMAALELERGEKAEASRLWARRAALVEDGGEAARLLMRAAALVAGSPREESLVEDALARAPGLPAARVRRAELRAGPDPRGALEDVEVALGAPAGGADAPTDAERVALLRRAAALALKAGLADTARRHLAAFAQRRPADVDAQLELADLHRQAGAREALLELLGALWPRLPHSRQAAARREYAELALALGRAGEALEALRAHLSAAPQDPWAAGALLSLLPAPGEGSAAEEAERLALLGVLVAAERDGEARAALLARRAGLLRGAGRLAEARADLAEAARLSSRPGPALAALAEVLRLAGEPAAELDAWLALLALPAPALAAPALLAPALAAEGGTPALARAAERLASLAPSLAATGEVRRARAAWAALVSLPEGPHALVGEARAEALLGLAEACRAEGDVEGASRALGEAAAATTGPRRTAALLARADVLEGAGRLREAAGALAEVRALAPGHALATARLEAALAALGDWGALADVLEEEASGAPDLSPPAAAARWVALATLVEERLGDAPRAEAALRRACAADAGEWGARVRLAGVLEARGQASAARALLEEAAAVLPPADAAPALRRAAALARRAGEADAALALARAAHRLVPAEGAELALLAELLEARGETAEALALQRLLAAPLFTEGASGAGDAGADALGTGGLATGPLATGDFGAHGGLSLGAAANDAPPEGGGGPGGGGGGGAPAPVADPVGVLLRLGALSEGAGDAAGAERAYRRLLALAPAQGGAAERLASLLEARDPRGALEVLWAHARTLPPSDAAAARLSSLAARARERLADVGLAAELLAHAARVAPSPLPALEARAALFREAARTSELLEALDALAGAALAAGEAGRALAAREEAAALAEGAGRVDVALASLAEVRRLHLAQAEGPGARAAAGAAELRRARLLRDARQDLAAAARALEEAFALLPAVATAREAAELARRQADPALEARWLERALPLTPPGAPRAALHLERAQQALDALASPERAEAAARAALAEAPGDAAAGALLEGLLEREGRHADLAALLEERAAQAPDAAARAALLRRAAALYLGPAGLPEAAAAALLAARGATPDDAALTRELADLLHATGRAADAAEFDAALLAREPLLPGVWARHRAALEGAGDWQALAALLLARAGALPAGPAGDAEAADGLLEAADALRQGGAEEQALLAEDAAFERAPGHAGALARQRARAGGDARRLAPLLARAAAALGEAEGAEGLLRERARRLLAAGESLLAADALDDYLARVPGDVEALAERAELAAAAGGPRAAQPFDRRLLAAAAQSESAQSESAGDAGAGGALPLALRLRTLLRLAHASLEAGAFTDAADHLEAALALAPADSREGATALSLLAEVHARRGDAEGVFRTTLLLARRAQGAEAEALLRRAADVMPDAALAVEALLPLAALRPTDEAVVERAVRGLVAAGRPAEAVALQERAAEASGGARAAALLLAAARLADGALGDGARALALRERAASADPASLEALRELAAERRRRGDVAGLLEVLPRLAERTEDAGARAALRLELAAAARSLGDAATARAALTAVLAEGPAGPRHAEALDALEELLRLRKDDAALAELLATRAARVEGAERARLLKEVSECLVRTGRLEAGIAAACASVEAHPDAEALLDLAALYALQGDTGEAARAKVRAAGLTAPGPERTRLLLEAADALAPLAASAPSEAARAGLRAEALEALERVHAEDAAALPALALAPRLSALGEHARALSVAFAPLMAEGTPASAQAALALADRAQDAARALEALWALAGGAERTAVQHLERLAGLLRAAGDWAGLLRLAEVVDAQAPTVAAPLLDEVLFGPAGAAERERALRLHLAREQGDAYLLALLPRLGGGAPEELVDVALVAVRALPPARREAALQAAVAAFPARAPGLLQALYELQREHGRPEDAERTLARLLEAEPEAAARARLGLERAALLLHRLGAPERAREAAEQALSDAPDSAEALQLLLALTPVPAAAERVLALGEGLERVAGASALGPHRERLADAAEAAGRGEEALRHLAALEATPARLERRARLAEALGQGEEALSLREALARTPEEREAVLRGWLELGRADRALALAPPLLSAGGVAPGTRRLLALLLSAVPEGAALACQLWPDVLSAAPADFQGWGAFAEALRQEGRGEAAARAAGLADALTDTRTDARAGAPAAPMVGAVVGAVVDAVVGPVERPVEPAAALPEAPAGAVEVTADTMPRLHATLAPALASLGLPGLPVVLDVEGGVEAYVARPGVVVLGAAALGCFGPAELVYLCALALALGGQGGRLAQPGAPVPALPLAARRALRAVPGTLAAARVLAQLDASVRGGDPSAVRPSRVLPGSEAFAALTLEVLTLG
jgi:tetratricopeptide (TPR) repeat protein